MDNHLEVNKERKESLLRAERRTSDIIYEKICSECGVPNLTSEMVGMIQLLIERKLCDSDNLFNLRIS